jgi:hypothetical protein
MKLTLKPVNSGTFNCLPSREVELNEEEVLCNNVILPWEFNPHKVTLYVIGHEFGAVGAVWASHEQDALDELIDSGLGKSFLVSEEDQSSATEDEREDWTHLGNASEPCDLTNAWIQQVRLEPSQDFRLLCAFAEARGACKDNLWKW